MNYLTVYIYIFFYLFDIISLEEWSISSNDLIHWVSSLNAEEFYTFCFLSKICSCKIYIFDTQHTEQGRKSRAWWLGITCCSAQTEAASSFLNQDALTVGWRRQETWSSGSNLKNNDDIYAFALLDSRLGVKMIVLFALGEWSKLTDHSDMNEQLLTQIQFALVHFFKNSSIIP